RQRECLEVRCGAAFVPVRPDVAHREMSAGRHGLLGGPGQAGQAAGVDPEAGRDPGGGLRPGLGRVDRFPQCAVAEQVRVYAAQADHDDRLPPAMASTQDSDDYLVVARLPRTPSMSATPPAAKATCRASSIQSMPRV